MQAPAVGALKHLGYPPYLYQIDPMETFTIVWVELPLLASLFLASPWVLYQAWAFIAPGLYAHERKRAVPFVLSTAGLFITGGVFAYFVVFRYGLEFLLGIGKDVAIAPMVSLQLYFKLFDNVVLGVAVAFELPVLIFSLIALRVVTPGFLLRNSRYAVLGVVLVAAFITPTQDISNLMLLTGPMVVLFFSGVFAGYLLLWKRDRPRFSRKIIVAVSLVVAALLCASVWVAVVRYGVSAKSITRILYP